MIKAVAVIIAVVGVLAGAGPGTVRAAACDVPIFAYRHGNLFLTEDGRVERVRVEVADTEDRLEVGLMCRPSLDPDAGMLFVFAAPTRASFWMKNTLILSHVCPGKAVPVCVGGERRLLLQARFGRARPGPLRAPGDGRDSPQRPARFFEHPRWGEKQVN